MAEPKPGSGSVFARLVAAMLTMALCLLLLVTAFFLFIAGPNINGVIFQLAKEYSRALAASSPPLDLASARRIAASMDVNIRYDAPVPGGGWTTSESLPSADDVRSGRVRGSHLLVSPRYWVFPASLPPGGTYLFSWNFNRRVQMVHWALLGLLLVVIVGVVWTTHAVLRRLLAPLKVLSDGVARLGEGQLDVMLPNGTRDEFGRLTTAFNTMVGRVCGMIRDRDQLLVDVSHELRSPLTRMKVALELPQGDTQHARLATDVGEMERMVTELLELERLRSGRGLTVASEDLVSMMHDVAAEFRDRPPGVRVVAAARALAADVDADKVRMVLRNLLENAVKYSLPESRPVEMAASNGANAVVIRVTDDGVGIPESEIGRVFEPFFRVDASRSKRTGGYGLGLSICKRIMEAHGGTITVQRGGGDRGASFVLTFPIKDSRRS